MGVFGANEIEIRFAKWNLVIFPNFRDETKMRHLGDHVFAGSSQLVADFDVQCSPVNATDLLPLI